ncbi:hypothetical protein GCK72_004080 [Caenorhabditis remanei]|uniref:BTB domain-containing protein n=1 Tax=Caenorhabditis remanei TaxID=31234 RepID=A0A6A5HCN2_CAERE|nr:hypothetical protein GCK72_004080 [Caenorhabditis remanei]KAF1764133.1 hypothetical protein GCK72_004080 [Caenorhabditis remanei]
MFSECTFSDNNVRWKFDWDELKPHGVFGLTGHIKATIRGQVHTVNVDVKNPVNTVLFRYSQDNIFFTTYEPFNFKYALVARYLPIKQYDALFLPSDFTDIVLKVEDKTLHVNKVFLSIHSEYFRALFSENSKKGQINEIEIMEASYIDICLLFGTIYPETIFPDDSTVDKLLELADRFMMPSVIRHVEYHLLNNTKIKNEKLMCLADKFGMTKLLDKTIKEIRSIQEAKLLKTCEACKELSESTKAKLYHRLMEII